MPEEDLLSPDGRLAARWYVWRTSHDTWDQDTYWRVEVLNPRTKLVLLTRSYAHGFSQKSRHETGADVAACDFSPDSRRLVVRLSDGTTEDLDLSALEIDPPFDETLHYRLDWTPWPPSGVRIRIVERTHGHPHRDLELPPVAGRPPVRRVGFGEHPGLVSVIRQDGSVETLPYGRRAWPADLASLCLDPSGRFRGSFLTHDVGLPGDPGGLRGSFGLWDDLTGRQVASYLRDPIASFSFESAVLIRLVGPDGKVEDRRLSDLLLPFGDLQPGPDGARLLRVCTMIDDPPGREQVRWSLLELIDAGDARTLGKLVLLAPLVKRERETLTISDFRKIPDGPRRELPRALVAARFAGPDVVRVTLEGGEERDLRPGRQD